MEHSIRAAFTPTGNWVVPGWSQQNGECRLWIYNPLDKVTAVSLDLLGTTRFSYVVIGAGAPIDPSPNLGTVHCLLAGKSVADHQGSPGSGALLVRCTTTLIVSAFQSRGEHTWPLAAHPLTPG